MPRRKSQTPTRWIQNRCGHGRYRLCSVYIDPLATVDGVCGSEGSDLLNTSMEMAVLILSFFGVFSCGCSSGATCFLMIVVVVMIFTFLCVVLF